MKFKVLTAILLSFVFSVSAFAAFAIQNEYTEGLFTDVPSTEWYASEVKSTYELGLMNGSGQGLFSPKGNVTVAEAITLCARVNSIYNGKQTPTNSTTGNWYDSYVEYAIANGFVKQGQFDSYTRSITRAEMAVLFYDAMPEGYYKKINHVRAVPDVDKNAPYYDKLLRLYGAGIVMGNDAYGNFYPNSNIVRSEVAAIINRVAIEENRVRRALLVQGEGKRWEPTIFHTDDPQMGYNNMEEVADVLLSPGWDYKSLGQFGNEKDGAYAALADTYPSEEVSIKRDITPITGGTFHLETTATTNSTKGGFYHLLTNDDEEDVIRVYGENGVYKIKSGDKVYTTDKKIVSRSDIKIYCDFDKKVADFYVNGNVVATFDVASNAKEITKYIIGTTEEAQLLFTPETARLTSNYLFIEKFYLKGGDLSQEWIKSSENVTSDGKVFDANTVAINAKAGTKEYIRRYFEASSGKYAFETVAHTPHGTSGVYFTVKAGDTEAFTVSTEDNTFVAPDGTDLRTYTDNVCQTLRIVVDTDTKKATAYVNGKNCGEFNFVNNVNYVDNIEIGINATENITLCVDDIEAFPIHEYDDYVPTPVPALSDNYEIGVNVCNIWRNGYHHGGWKRVSNYEEFEPLIGYYDEGNPEVADWEIKFMAEHGIDCQNVCWYAPSRDVKTPIKGGNSMAIEKAFFHAKYSDMLKFCLLWENNGGTLASGGFEAFKKYVWPYWVDYYFTDDRYMRTVDNKAFMMGWVSGPFIEDFGGTAGAKAAIDWMNEEIKKYGYDGIVILFYDQQQKTNTEFFQNIEDAGLHGTYAYALGTDGWDPDVQIERHKLQRSLDISFISASIGIGYNSVAKDQKRFKIITLEDYEKVCLFMRDEFLPEVEGDGVPWHSRTIILSTWNEYGEGHYIMPCKGNYGFGYLDVVRKIFTDDPEPEGNDVVPTEAQKARITQLYPQNHALFKKLDMEKKVFDNYFCEDFVDLTEYDSVREGMQFSSFVHDTEKGTITATTNGNNSLFYVDNLEIRADSIPVIHLHMKKSVVGDCEIFFTTKSSTTFNQANAMRIYISKEEEGEWVDLYYDMDTLSGWTGTITGLRIDPGRIPGETIEIDLIEFMVRDKTKLSDISIDGDNITADITVEPRRTDDNHIMVAINHGSGILSRMSLYFEYSRKLGTFYLESKEHTLLMTVGSDKAIYDGKEVTMPFTYTLRDGLPYVALDYIAEAMGHTVVFEDSTLKITTENYKYFEKLLEIIPFEYEFNIAGYPQGWTSSGATMIVTEDGRLVGEAEENEDGEYKPKLISPDLNIYDYQYVSLEVRMKAPNVANQTANVYFSTSEKDKGEDTKLSVPFADAEIDKDGYAVLTFNLSENANWKGLIKNLEFVPFEGAGSYDIDYIKFIENPDIDPSLRTSVVKYGDAETPDKLAFVDGDNKLVPIVTDPEDSDNHCYLIAGGKSYQYFVKNFIFEPGATYRMEFDLRLKGYNGEDALVERCSINGLAQYADPTNARGVNHAWSVITLGTNEGWVHVNTTFTVNSVLADQPEEIRAQREKVIIYSNPVDGKAVDFYVDNFTLNKLS